jgi:hypothetical protein
MEIVSDENEIISLQRKFEERLKRVADEEYEITLGWMGGNITEKTYYSKELGIWFAFDKGENRYWNAFGLGKPKLQGSNSIVVEINFAFVGVDKRIAGSFIKDNGKVLVCHRGRIGGGRPDIGFRAFWDQYTGETITVGNERFAVIGDIDSEDFPERVKNFIIEVNRIKSLITEGGELYQEVVEEGIEEKEFALSVERDIQNYIVSNPESLEKGLKIVEKEYVTAIGRIDILGIDKSSNYVVIEIKAGTADISTFGQISSYIGAIQRDLAKGQKVRGIIIANDFDEKLKIAISTNHLISLKKYKVNFQFVNIE